jgi:hypothetical protein
MNTMKINTGYPLDASKDIGLKVNAEGTMHMSISRHEYAGKYHNTSTAKEYFENAAKFRYLGTTVTNQNRIHEEIKGRSHSERACYLPFHNTVFPFVRNNLRIKV